MVLFSRFLVRILVLEQEVPPNWFLNLISLEMVNFIEFYLPDSQLS